MKTFIIICEDKRNSLKKRLENREHHLTHLKSLKKNLILAGPTLDTDGNPNGSILIINFTNKIELQKFLEKDPYVKENLFKSVLIKNFKRVF